MRRPWLLPFMPLYGMVVWLRNRLFDAGILRSTRFDTPTLIVGNLNAGGSGKTPHTEYLLRVFDSKNRAVISRGYGRKSKGFYWVELSEQADKVGDEPLQMKTHFPDVPMAVCEDRVLAVPELLGEFPETDLILFDDAYQHRYLDGTVRVLLTVHSDMFTDDFLLPAGNLREAKKEAKRADIIVVTKCPGSLNAADRERCMEKIRPYSSAPVFFSAYEALAPVTVNEPYSPLYDRHWNETPVFVFSAIANGSKWALPYLHHFKEKAGELCYPDHHRFTKRDIDLFLKKWEAAEKPIVITTEKDWMRLRVYKELLAHVPILFFPIEVRILSDEQALISLLEEKLFTEQGSETYD